MGWSVGEGIAYSMRGCIPCLSLPSRNQHLVSTLTPSQNARHDRHRRPHAPVRRRGRKKANHSAHAHQLGQHLAPLPRQDLRARRVALHRLRLRDPRRELPTLAPVRARALRPHIRVHLAPSLSTRDSRELGARAERRAAHAHAPAHAAHHALRQDGAALREPRRARVPRGEVVRQPLRKEQRVHAEARCEGRGGQAEAAREGGADEVRGERDVVREGGAEGRAVRDCGEDGDGWAFDGEDGRGVRGRGGGRGWGRKGGGDVFEEEVERGGGDELVCGAGGGEVAVEDGGHDAHVVPDVSPECEVGVGFVRGGREVQAVQAPNRDGGECSESSERTVSNVIY